MQFFCVDTPASRIDCSDGTATTNYHSFSTLYPVLKHVLVKKSENQFQAQLNLAHCRGCGGNSPYTGIQGPSRIAKDIIAGCSKVRMVQEVEELCPKLKVLPLPQPIVLDERKIQVHLSRADQGVSPYISKITQRLDDKIRRVEITFRGPVIEHRIVVPARAKVWSLVTALRHTAGLARSHLDIDGQAAADRIAPVDGPVGQEVTERCARLLPPMTAGPVRKLVGVRKNEVVLNMQRREAPIGRKILPVVDCEAGGSSNLFRPLDSSSSSIIDVPRPSVGPIECQTGAQAFFHNQLESVVNLIANGSDIAKRSEIGVGHLCIRRGELPAVLNDCRPLVGVINRKQIGRASCRERG